MVPNTEGTEGHRINTRNHQRHETHFVMGYMKNRNPSQSLQENVITAFELRLYNSLPKYLRDMISVKIEKKIGPENF